MALINPEIILTALNSVIYPDLNKDIVSLDFVRDIKVEGTNLSLRLTSPNPSPEAKANLDKAVREVLSKLPALSDTQLIIETEVPNGKGASGKQAIAGV